MMVKHIKPKLVLLAATECQYPQYSSSHKVRIYQKDLCRDKEKVGSTTSASMCTGQRLHEEIVKQSSDLRNICPTMSVCVEIYNPKTCGFESVLHPNIRDCDIVKTYGNRIRCTLQVTEKHSLSAVSTEQGDGDEIIKNCKEEEGARTDLLQIAGRYFPYNPNGMDFGGKKIIVNEMVNNKIDGTGLNVWDGALLLALYLEKLPEKVRSKSILELGAGTGFVGIACSILGASDVVITDLDYTIALMNENIALNHNNNAMDDDRSESETGNYSFSKIKCQVCNWFDPPDIAEFGLSSTHPELIMVADCVWVEELVDPLMNTLEKYCSEETQIIITYQQRGKGAHERFWSRLKVFDCVIVDTMDRCGLEKPDSFSLIECRMRRRNVKLAS